MAFYWISLQGGEQAPLTIRVLSRNWDVHYDIAGGNRIPRISERKARTVAELRAAGIGVRRVLMIHDNTPHSSDLFEMVLTTLDADVVFDVAHPVNGQSSGGNSTTTSTRVLQDIERAAKVGREVAVHTLSGERGPAIVQLALEKDYDLIVLDAPPIGDEETAGEALWQQYVREHASCAVCLLSLATIQREVVDSTPSVVLGAEDRKLSEH
jgi:nucleotide-binding universal stress UspA family protein